jgi:hypothetical protein
MKGIASSLSHGTTSNNPKKTKLTEDEECDTFGSYLTESLRKLDPETRHIAQYHVNNILFQAQMGILNKSQMVPQQQQPFFAQQQFPSQVQQQFISPHPRANSPQEWTYVQEH